jgi:hypothetical protein
MRQLCQHLAPASRSPRLWHGTCSAERVVRDFHPPDGSVSGCLAPSNKGRHLFLSGELTSGALPQPGSAPREAPSAGQIAGGAHIEQALRVALIHPTFRTLAARNCGV